MKLGENLPLIALAVLIVAFGVWQFESFTFLLDESVKSILKQ
jgi:hydrogenase-4 component F